ncbi:MAG: copper resistance protein NlpE N-terminal domain-containing protein, partial [Muribaculaceae bacterium]|nr:copper resistance protein NlpE N-terminal domain-containing protein [Muribaculaceae bacterium]
MKKAILFVTAALAMVGMVACSSNDCSKGSCDKAKCDNDQIYTGILPAADCDGIRYSLKLDYDDNGQKGDYDLIEVYLESDTTTVTGIKDSVAYKSEGDFTVVEKDGKKYLKLVKDAKDSNAQASDELYFEVGEGTITMVNSDYEAAAMPELYTL